MTNSRDWEQWQKRWRELPSSAADVDLLIDRARRARRNVTLVRAASAAMAVFAILVVGAALRHAGNLFEISLGIAVAAGIAAVWYLDLANDRDGIRKLDAPEDEYRAARRALCRRHEQFARLGWIVVALDLVFLVPWWIGGARVHGSGFHPVQILTIWTPLGVMALFVAWTIVLRKRARAELQE